MEQIVLIRMDALSAMLFWVNAISFVFLLLYYRSNWIQTECGLILFLVKARLCHALHYFLISGRGYLPDLLSVNIGIMLLLIGCYYEAQAIMRLIKEDGDRATRLLLALLAVFIVALNVVELAAPSGGNRITMAALGVVAIMAWPIGRMLLARGSSVFTKAIAVLYGAFLVLNVCRAAYGFTHPEAGILDTNALQSATFLVLLFQLIIALPAYSLIIKEYADEALLRMATTDKLTGATNRHAFLDAAAVVYRNSRAFKTPLSVLFLDIDYFKKVNDQYGHVFGDAVLTRLAEIIHTCLRDSDLSCRYGGEEFVILLARGDLRAAQAVARRIMNEVRSARFSEQPEFSFTVSIGVYSGVPHPEQTFDEIIRYADEAMYQAKNAGRNQVALSEMCDAEESTARPLD